MKRDLDRLAQETFDVVIIGGGINGLATAWDASLRGFSVALVEKGDFGGATSAASQRLVHGGLRYLQQMDLRNLRESEKERTLFMILAPHLVFPLPFLIPTYGHFMKGKEILHAGFTLYDLLSTERHRIKDPSKKIPNHRGLSRSECLRRVPGVFSEGLTGGIIYYDGQMLHSERLSISFGLSAAEAGACLANYVQVKSFLTSGTRIQGLVADDLVTGRSLEIKGRAFLNATGPWSDITLGLLRDPDPPRRVRRSKGIQILTRNLTDGFALGVQSRHQIEDAWLSRGSRLFFITPWRGHSMIGTTDSLYEGDPDRFEITHKDVSDFVQEINESLPSANLKSEEVLWAVGGLRPITEKDVEQGRLSRTAEICDHAKGRQKIDNLVSVVGVKYTTCRGLAERIVDLLAAKLKSPPPRSTTHTQRLWGGEIQDFERFLSMQSGEIPGLPEGVWPSWARLYGTKSLDMLKEVQNNPSLADPIKTTPPVLKLEVLRAVRDEMALKLSDVVLRRTDMGSLGFPGQECLKTCASVMAKELGWDEERQRREVEKATRAFAPCLPGKESDPSDASDRSDC